MQAKQLNRLIELKGVSLTINVSGTDVEFKGFLQPLRYKNKIYLSGVPTELGFDSLQKYLLITDARIPLEKINGTENKLYFDGFHIKVDRCEKVYFNGEPLYYWAVISKEE